MRTLVSVLGAAAAVVLFSACEPPPNPGPDGLYLGVQPDITTVVTPKADPITWGAAPNIDEHYGGVLYEGTDLAQQDPRPPLLSNGRQPLRLWVADPDDGRTNRPAIVWFHGGGFAAGIDSMWGLANGVGAQYAKRGYVSISVEYRIDTTLVGTGGRPPSLCQWVQDNVDEDDPLWIDRRDQCERNILAAQHDAQASVRWVRRHAADLGIDQNKIAIGGFSAGAVIASTVAYQTDAKADLGGVFYFTGDGRSVVRSKVQAAIGASGCLPTLDFQPPTNVAAGDAPASFIQSELDQAVTYECNVATFATARDAGLVAELTSYCDRGGHANALYNEFKAATDDQWTTFLAREMKIYSGMRPPSVDPFC